MGCRQSQRHKSTKEPATTELKVQEPIGNGKENEFTDICQDASKSCERMGLTFKQIFSLRQSWKAIKRNMEETGVEIFLR